ncbi:MAG: phosphotransferase, partial [Candidatus Aureabacteria bacterium]|nr:phosphotransferase [Candidatus Auribacterota bacterium]
MAESKEKRIGRFMERRKNRARPVPLRGDASARSFYRIRDHGHTAVMMLYDEPRPEDERLFIEVRDHLAACGAPVPEIYDYDPGTGVILLQDCGDCTLEEEARGAGKASLRALYRMAVDELLAIQITGTARGGKCVAFTRAFDEAKLGEELDFFMTHTVEGFFHARLAPVERETLSRAFAALA